MERVESAKATESNPHPRVIRGPGLEWRDLQLRIKPASAGNTGRLAASALRLEESNPRTRVILRCRRAAPRVSGESNPRMRVIPGSSHLTTMKFTESNPRMRVIRLDRLP